MSGQSNFTATVDKWVLQTNERIQAVIKTAAQSVIEEVSILTPVDTGYLRASLTVTFNAPLPIRRDAKPAEGQTYQAPNYSLSISGMEAGDTIFASFVAAYAAAVEYGARGRAGRGMVRLAAQNWQEHVNRAVAQAKAAVG